MNPKIAFGPVPSRRLGQSIGINNIPPKRCSYSCVYCQLGHTTHMRAVRRTFYRPQEILEAVASHIDNVDKAGNTIDYLTFVADGEPTLDINLGRAINLLRPLGIKIAVISNSSLLTRADVQEDLTKADWVSLKIDSNEPETWRRINRPIIALQLPDILDATLRFSEMFSGRLVTETMLVRYVNSNEHQIRKIADHLVELNPVVAYLSIPLRPPAIGWVQAPRNNSISRAQKILSRHQLTVECLTGHEENRFLSTGDLREDLLGITAVHPLRRDALHELMASTRSDWSIVEGLISEKKLFVREYEGNIFYINRSN